MATSSGTGKKPGPPVPPRPQHALSSQRDSLTNRLSNGKSNDMRLPSESHAPPPLKKKPATLPSPSPSAESNGNRFLIFKSSSLQENSSLPQSVATTKPPPVAVRTSSSASSGSKPPLKLRKAPDVPRQVAKPPTKKTEHEEEENEEPAQLRNTSSAGNNIVIVQSNSGVTLNRHHSMAAPKPAGLSALKDSRLSLSRVDFDKVGKIHLDQLPQSQPLPKPRKIVHLPVATLDVEEINSCKSFNSSPASVSIFRRSKTTLDNLTGRGGVTNGSNSSSNTGFLSGRTVEIKNNLKNAAERLFSEIMMNQQQKQQQQNQHTIESNTHERAKQQPTIPMASSPVSLKSNLSSKSITVVSTGSMHNVATATSTPNAFNSENANCTTRINISSSNASTPSISSSNCNQTMTNESLLNKKKTAFHELLISELAAMRSKSSSMENLQTKDNKTLMRGYSGDNSSAVLKSSCSTIIMSTPNSTDAQTNAEAKSIKNLAETSNIDLNSDALQQDKIESKLNSTEQHSVNANNNYTSTKNESENPELNEVDNLHKLHKIASNTSSVSSSSRKRCPSGCSSDSSPYGTERSARIRTSDWIEVEDNGKQVTLTSCHISLEDSGMEDEERLSSSGVGDSWDSVKEAEQEQKQRCRSTKR